MISEYVFTCWLDHIGIRFSLNLNFFMWYKCLFKPYETNMNIKSTTNVQQLLTFLFDLHGCSLTQVKYDPSLYDILVHTYGLGLFSM